MPDYFGNKSPFSNENILLMNCSVSENYPIKSDYSVIVEEEGYLVETQYGSLFRHKSKVNVPHLKIDR